MVAAALMRPLPRHRSAAADPPLPAADGDLDNDIDMEHIPLQHTITVSVNNVKVDEDNDEKSLQSEGRSSYAEDGKGLNQSCLGDTSLQELIDETIDSNNIFHAAKENVGTENASNIKEGVDPCMGVKSEQSVCCNKEYLNHEKELHNGAHAIGSIKQKKLLEAVEETNIVNDTHIKSTKDTSTGEEISEQISILGNKFDMNNHINVNKTKPKTIRPPRSHKTSVTLSYVRSLESLVSKSFCARVVRGVVAFLNRLFDFKVREMLFFSA